MASEDRNIYINTSIFSNFFSMYILLKTETGIIIKIIINSYSFYAVTLKRLRTQTHNGNLFSFLWKRVGFQEDYSHYKKCLLSCSWISNEKYGIKILEKGS